MSSTTSASSFASASSSALPDDIQHARHNTSPIVTFIIGLSIILLSSILNAGGLNLTKLDHVRTRAVPKSERRKDWLRPLWLLGMISYVLSQMIGSTLALQYMRAEYVAPLGSASLIFNFLFASVLVGTPVTRNDIYGTIVVIFGVIGIVLFGSINDGLQSEMDIVRLQTLWGRTNWILYFLLMSISLSALYIFVSQLDLILAARSDLASEPFASARRLEALSNNRKWPQKVRAGWEQGLLWVRGKLEVWTAEKSEKNIAWTLGIGWACCGGALAGGCLVFAKASVQMISGSLSRENTGNQFGHFASIITFFFLAVTAISQILCLNRGLIVYDSTLVVPVFYGVYTASGWLNSLIFNDEVDAYQSWTLFLIFVAMIILISGVVLLTHKKPDNESHTSNGVSTSSLPNKAAGPKDHIRTSEDNDSEIQALRTGDEEQQVLWDVGDASDEETENADDRNSQDRQPV